jgi:tetratricopeptide (TPR) repeat protein
MMKRLLIGLGLLVMTAGMPIAPAIAQLSAEEAAEMLIERAAQMTPEEAAREKANYEAALKEQQALKKVQEEVRTALTNSKAEAALQLVVAFRRNYPKEIYAYSEAGVIKEEYLKDLTGALKEYEAALGIARTNLKEAKKLEEKFTQEYLSTAGGEPKEQSAAQTLLQSAMVNTVYAQQQFAEQTHKIVNLFLMQAEGKNDPKALAIAKKLIDTVPDDAVSVDQRINRARSNELVVLKYGNLTPEKKVTAIQQTQALFDSGIKKYPNHAQGYLYRGLFKARALKDNAGAKADLKKAYELSIKQQWKAGIDRSTAALKALEGMTEASAPTVPTAKAAVTAPKTAAPATQQLHFSQVSTQARASYDRGLAKFNQQDFKGAIAEFDQALKAQPNYPEALNWRGGAYNQLDDSKQAIASWNQAIQLKSDYSRPYYNRGLVKGSLGDIEGAMSDLNTAIRLEPTLAVAYNYRGLAKGSLGDTEGAISDLNTAIRLEPTLAQAYNNRGSIFIKQGKTDAALKDFRQAVQMAPKNGSFYSNLCRAELANYNEQAGFDACDRAISLGYEHPVAYTNRGVARLRLKDPKAKAIADFDQAIKLDPEEAAAYFNRGHQLILTDPSKRQAGIRDLETALRLSKKQGGQSKEWIQNLEQEIASFKSPGSKPAQTKRSETAKDSTSDDDQSEDFFAELTELLNQPKKK